MDPSSDPPIPSDELLAGLNQLGAWVGDVEIQCPKCERWRLVAHWIPLKELDAVLAEMTSCSCDSNETRGPTHR